MIWAWYVLLNHALLPNYVFLNNLAINGKMVDVVSALLACVAFYSVTIYD